MISDLSQATPSKITGNSVTYVHPDMGLFQSLILVLPSSDYGGSKFHAIFEDGADPDRTMTLTNASVGTIKMLFGVEVDPDLFYMLKGVDNSRYCTLEWYEGKGQSFLEFVNQVASGTHPEVHGRWKFVSIIREVVDELARCKFILFEQIDR
jgi:hypothetical protein